MKNIILLSVSSRMKRRYGADQNPTYSFEPRPGDLCKMELHQPNCGLVSIKNKMFAVVSH